MDGFSRRSCRNFCMNKIQRVKKKNVTHELSFVRNHFDYYYRTRIYNLSSILCLFLFVCVCVFHVSNSSRQAEDCVNHFLPFVTSSWPTVVPPLCLCAVSVRSCFDSIDWSDKQIFIFWLTSESKRKEKNHLKKKRKKGRKVWIIDQQWNRVFFVIIGTTTFNRLVAIVCSFKKQKQTLLKKSFKYGRGERQSQ